jgi:hypothetical protein
MKRRDKRTTRSKKIERELVARLRAELKLLPASTIRTAADVFKVMLLGAKRG